ncbi:hypothetical protein SAMN02927921_03016 [Sinomicrobium oceani]|uniref:Uncharacterized protein n=1 Tax=Sinomicrobium oceani TaxID=1150368 RepID=A0A1K1QZX1_9FLAO|nr:hypothetical protein SAMN02927921_03016 [Sinomicrobium oceani]
MLWQKQLKNHSTYNGHFRHKLYSALHNLKNFRVPTQKEQIIARALK